MDILTSQREGMVLGSPEKLDRAKGIKHQPTFPTLKTAALPPMGMRLKTVDMAPGTRQWWWNHMFKGPNHISNVGQLDSVLVNPIVFVA